MLKNGTSGAGAPISRLFMTGVSPITLNDVSQDQVKKLREEAENQLKQYSIDEKYSKTLGQTHLVKLVLIFCGHRLVYHGEIGSKA